MENININRKIVYSKSNLNKLQFQNNTLYNDSLMFYNSLYMASNSELKANHYKTLFYSLKSQQISFNRLSVTLQNSLFDLKNSNKYIIPLRKHKRIHKKDSNDYKLIFKSQKLKENNIISYLKELKTVHKISKAQYKESIKRIKINKPLRENVRSKLNMLLLANKGQKPNNSISGLARKNSKIIKIEHKGYKINIQKSFLHIKKNKLIILETLSREFNNKLKFSDKLI